MHATAFGHPTIETEFLHTSGVNISEVIASKRLANLPTYSAEFFPPKSADGDAALWQTLHDLQEFDLDFVSVTYGAGGSTQERSIELVRQIIDGFGLPTLAHLTCVSKTAAELRATVQAFTAVGVKDILALRGDPPTGIGTEWVETAGGYRFALELVKDLATNFKLGIAVAAFPEGHPESKDLNQDVEVLLAKQQAGADFAITNLFFKADKYFELVERAEQVGVTIPILPGLMPVTNIKQIDRFAQMTGAEFPAELRSKFAAVAADDESVRALGVELTTSLATELLAAKAPGVHLYTLNKSDSSARVFRNLMN